MKILLLRFSSIGDIVLTSPVARCLKQQLGAEVHYLTKRTFAAIHAANPYVERTYSFVKEVTECLPALRREHYDWVIDLHQNLRSWRVKWALHRPSRAFQKLNFEKWLLVQTGIDRLPPVHIVDRYLEAVHHLGVQYDGQGLDYFIPATEEVDIQALSANLSPSNYVVFVIGANHATKQLPAAQIAAVCQELGRPVVLVGGQTDRENGAAIAARVGPSVVNTCGQLSLHQSASVIRQAYKVATHDTGMMHIAAAFRKEIVSIWGNTVPKFGMFPFYPENLNLNTTMEVGGLPCRPCSKIGFKACPKGHFRCMLDQNLGHIARALK